MSPGVPVRTGRPCKVFKALCLLSLALLEALPQPLESTKYFPQLKSQFTCFKGWKVHLSSAMGVYICVRVRKITSCEILTGTWLYVEDWRMAWTWTYSIGFEHEGRIVQQTYLGSGNNLVWLELQMEEKRKFEVKEWGHVRDDLGAIGLRSEAASFREKRQGMMQKGWQTGVNSCSRT